MPGMSSYGLEQDGSLADIKLVMTADCGLIKRNAIWQLQCAAAF